MVIISNTSYFQSVLSPTMPFISEVSKSDSYSLPLSLASPVSPPPSSPPAGLNAFPSPYTPVLSTSVSTCSRKALGESHNAPSTFPHSSKGPDTICLESQRDRIKKRMTSFLYVFKVFVLCYKLSSRM